ncbi:type 1 periplasmic binding fold superfamily protein [Sinomicrobium pectinilyticum]|uniref:Type 1 periplasmic binding fold superfamily protein n=1 Tax=Sinomicrobium pectinilyticum TaxID=1084421 RepID=A0A3N0EZN8_SINP1|nr:type 1 periplasmic binding fold superfamily protein [Sinomicrobium pectinilyticum]RNL93370.1 type 1 periplasmic binding fold superfamily protein [Sinomicrobium pectinilyticum]
MKTIKLLAFLCTGALFFTSCSSDDDNPDPVNEEELITKVTITLQAENAETVTMEYSDESGLGHDHDHDHEGEGAEDDHDHDGLEGVVSGPLKPNTSYTGSIALWNESVSPAENITDEIKEEADEHQFFYQAIGGLEIDTDYLDKESDYLSTDSSNPVGLQFNLTTGAAGHGDLRVVLRHQPKKPNTGLDDAGGETDMDISFHVHIEE